MFSFSVIELYLEDDALKFRVGGVSTDFGDESDTYIDTEVGLDFIDISKPNEEGVLLSLFFITLSYTV